MGGLGLYILDEHGNPVGASDTLEWAVRCFGVDAPSRVLRQDTIGPLLISTVFLGIDHNFGCNGPPVLWETMVFGEDDGMGGHDQRRYSSRQAALEGHRECVDRGYCPK